MIGSPYRGLEPYDEESARYFFGRDRDIRLIAANMFGAPLTLLYGPSGVGKTSVLLAGVLPALDEREHCFTASLRSWQDDPRVGLRQAFGAAEGEPAPLVELVRRSSAGGKRIMLVLDQFEEYFLYWPEGHAFERDLAEALTEPDLPFGALISIREDAVARLDRFEGRIPQLFDNILRIGNLDRAGAVEAIERPIARFNDDHPDERVELEPGLADAVLAGMQILRPPVVPTSDHVAVTESFETPWLQLMMLELWRELDGPGGRRLGPETLKGLGSVTEVVDRHVEAALGALSERDQDVAARIFAYLVTPSGSKIAHTSSDLAVYSEIPQRQLRGVLTELAGEARILRTVPPPPDQPRESAYEIYHDVLGRAILAWGARHAGKRDAEQVRERQARSGVEWITEADGVFAAGGIKMLGLAGALLGFAEHPTKPVRRWVEVAGSGGGALVASLLATGHDAADVTAILAHTNFGDFADTDYPSFLGRLVPRYLGRGYVKGDRFRLWLDEVLSGATFASVKRPDTGYRLRVIAADVTHGRMLLLPDDLPLYRLPGEKEPIDPDSFRISAAVRMSMSIPYYFEPVELVSVETGARATILDGGLFAELPIWIFDSPGLVTRPTFGFRVVGRQGIDPEDVRKQRRPRSGQLGYDIFQMTSDSFDARFTTRSARVRTCVIDAGTVGTTQFDLTAATADMLVQAGRHAAATYLDRFSIESYSNAYSGTFVDPSPPEPA